MPRRWLLLIAALWVTAGVVWAQQQQAPVFRTGVDTVPIYATVLDEFGDFVQHLTEDQFEVRDDGKVQPVTFFEAGFQPITAVMLIDTSQSVTLSLDLEREAAEQFVVRLMPEDRARVGSFSHNIFISPAFTGDRDELLRVIRDDLDIGNPTRLWDAIDETITDLKPLGGRRVIVVLTDGSDTFSHKGSGEVLDRARAEGVLLYAIRVPGSRRIPEVLPAPSPHDLLMQLKRDQTPPRGSYNVLPDMARLTGGTSMPLGRNDDVNSMFTRLISELHGQYVLGFTPALIDGRVHNLKVRVKQPQHLTVRARQSYIAANPSGS